MLPFTLSAEVEDSLLGYAFSDVYLRAETCYTHVGRVWLDLRTTLTTQAETDQIMQTVWSYSQLSTSQS